MVRVKYTVFKIYFSWYRQVRLHRHLRITEDPTRDAWIDTSFLWWQLLLLNCTQPLSYYLYFPFTCLYPFTDVTHVYSIHRFPGRRQMVSRDSEHIRNSQVPDLLPIFTEETHSSHMAANKLHTPEIPGSVHTQYMHMDLISRKTVLHVFFASWKCLSSSEISRHTNVTTAGSNMASEKHSSQHPAFSWLHL